MTSTNVITNPSYVSSLNDPFATAYFAPSFYNRVAYTYPVRSYWYRWAKKMAKKAA